MNNEYKLIRLDSVPESNYIKTPKELLHTGLSAFAKVLYISMLERLSLSVQNTWTDSDGYVYIIYTLKEAMDILECSKAKAVKVFAELDEGFIKRKHRGQGRPDIIYLNERFCRENNQTREASDTNEQSVCSHAEIASDNKASAKENEPSEYQNKNPKEYENNTTEGLNSIPLEVSETDSNNINNNKNKINKNNNNYPIIPVNHNINNINPNLIEDMEEYRDFIKINIDYDVLVMDREKGIIDEIVNSMVNAVCSQKEYIRISGEDIPQSEVKKKFLAMNQFHVEYVYDSLTKNKSPVKNMYAYLLTSIYRASDCINLHYRTQVNYDNAQAKRV